MKKYEDYTPNQACEEIFDRFEIKVGKNILHKILRTKHIIDDYTKITDESKYGQYFYSKVMPKAKITYTIMPSSRKLFFTDDGINYLGENLQDWLKEYRMAPKKKKTIINFEDEINWYD